MPEVAAFGNYNLYKDDSPIMSTLPTWFAGVMVKIDLLISHYVELQISQANYGADVFLEINKLLILASFCLLFIPVVIMFKRRLAS